jgi:hypothetical protein
VAENAELSGAPRQTLAEEEEEEEEEEGGENIGLEAHHDVEQTAWPTHPAVGLEEDEEDGDGAYIACSTSKCATVTCATPTALPEAAPQERDPTEWDIFVALDSYDSNDIDACVHMYANNRICVLDTDTVAEVKQKIARQLPQLLVEGTACALTDPNEVDGALADECPLVCTSLRDGSVVVCQLLS